MEANCLLMSTQQRHGKSEPPICVLAEIPFLAGKGAKGEQGGGLYGAERSSSTHPQEN
jgi:hypothetical protein